MPAIKSMDRISLQRNTRDLSQQYAAHTQRKKRMQGEEARYTLVLHSARKTLHMTINEYCLADTIHKLSGSRSPVPGWCYASKQQLGKSLGFSRQSIHAMINKLKRGWRPRSSQNIVGRCTALLVFRSLGCRHWVGLPRKT